MRRPRIEEKETLTVEEAISLFYANRPDIVFLDLGLPDGAGMDVL